MSHERPIGISILALFCTLVALLGLFASGAYFLIGQIRGELANWAPAALAMLALCVLYLALAFGLWRLLSYTRWFAPALLLVLAGVALADFMRNEVLDLAASLLFLLAAGANMAVVAWLRQPGVPELFTRAR